MPRHRALDKTSGILCFKVPLEDGHVTACISQSGWHARYGLGHGDAGFVEIYLATQPMIDAAVVRKVSAGARTPVALNAADL